MGKENESLVGILYPPADADTYLVDGDQDYLPPLTMGMYRAFLARGRAGMQALMIYTHLLFTYRLQRTDHVYATNDYIQRGLGIGERMVERAKVLLRKMGHIETIKRRDETGRIIKTYIKLNMLPNPGLVKSTPAEITGMDSTPAVFHPLDLDRKCLKKKKKMLEERNTPAGGISAKDRQEKRNPGSFQENQTAYLPLAEELAAAVRTTLPRQICNPAAWTKDIRLLIERDHATAEEVRQVLAWLPGAPTNGNFCWAEVVLSGAKLRKHFPRLLPEASKNGRNSRDSVMARLEREAQRTQERYGHVN